MKYKTKKKPPAKRRRFPSHIFNDYLAVKVIVMLYSSVVVDVVVVPPEVVELKMLVPPETLTQVISLPFSMSMSKIDEFSPIS